MTTFSAQAVLFDNDGVLVDSHPQVIAAWRTVSDEFSMPFDEVERCLAGVRARDTLARFVADVQLDHATRRLEELEVAYAVDTVAIPGAVALLQSLPEHRWAIVTSCTKRLGEARWAGANIPVPKVVVTAEDVTRGKPDPEPFLVGAHRLGVDPSEVIVFEDSPAGGAAGRAAGATVIAVGDQRWETPPAARVPDLASVSVVGSDDGPLQVHLAPGPTATDGGGR